MIVIVNYDPFGENSMVYTFENTCKEFPELPYNDGLKIIYFNTTGTKNVKKSIQELLLYLNSSKIEYVTNNSIAKLHNYVTDIKQEAEVINQFMTVGEWLDYEVRDAKIAAIAEGKALGHALGHAEGRAEGRAESLRNTLLNILSQKFDTKTADAFEEKILSADEDMISNWIIIAARSNTVTDFLEQFN